MDFVEGTLLSTVLKTPSENDQDVVVLNPDVDEVALNKIYGQIAEYLLQLSQLELPRIGAVTRDDDVMKWSVTKRPLTYNMNELASVAGYPYRELPTSTFEHSSDYFTSMAHMHLTHLRTQRNLADDPEIARARFIARHHFSQLISRYCNDDAGPFIPFCDDLRPSNMLVDPETLQITAVIDFEYTNAMPAQFTYDPPWWLLLSGPEMWLDRHAMEQFKLLYEPRMEQFIQALSQVENKVVLSSGQLTQPRLSARMRDSWESKRFWFDYAARKSFEVDAICWAAFSNEDDLYDLLDDETRAETEELVKAEMTQLKASKQDCTARFSQVDN